MPTLQRTATAVIRTLDLVKVYQLGSVPLAALDGVSVEIAPGEFVAVMGASGSGKSTFMNLLGCLDSPTSGTYWFEGRDVSALAPDALADIRNQRIGFVFQGFNLLSRTPALENVELPLLYAGARPQERDERAKAALLAVGLGDRLSHKPSELSGGQQQRVAIARALVNQPGVILADEPTGNLDSRSSKEIMQIFRDLNQSKGITIVLVTHEPDIAAWADRIIVFHDGKITEDRANRANAEMAS